MIGAFTLAARAATRELIAGTALLTIAVVIAALGSDSPGGSLLFGLLFAVVFPVPSA